MDLFPEDVRTALLRAGEIRREAVESPDDVEALAVTWELRPIVRIFIPEPRRVWLLTDIDPSFPDSAFGLADLGIGVPTIGYVSIRGLMAAADTLGLPIQRDPSFRPNRTLREYAIDATLFGHVVEDIVTADDHVRRISLGADEFDAYQQAVHAVESRNEITLAAEERRGREEADIFLEWLTRRRQQRGA